MHENTVNTSDWKKENGDASYVPYKSMFPTITQQILYKANAYDEFTQYMLVGS